MDKILAMFAAWWSMSGDTDKNGGWKGWDDGWGSGGWGSGGWSHGGSDQENKSF